MALSDTQKAMLLEIDRLVEEIRTQDKACPSSEIIPVTGSNLQTAITLAPEGATLDLIGRTFMQAIVIDKPLTLINGTIQAPPNCNDIVILRGSHINLKGGLLIRGDGTTKRGIMNDAMFVEIDDIQVRNIRRVGQETQALCMWNSPGPLKVSNSVLEAGSIGFLAGGSRPIIDNTIATGLIFDNVLFTRPIEWKGQGYACKNAFELKSAQDVLLNDCVMENVWAEGQAGSAIVLTAVNYGNCPDAIVQNVKCVNLTVRNAGNGINGLGYGQQDFPTRQSNNWEFVNTNWELSRIRNGGQGALIQVAKEPFDIHFDGGTCINDGGAFIRMSEPAKPVLDFSLRNMTINGAGTYGVFTPVGNRGANWNITFPGGIIEGNTLHAAHSTFKTNFPNNTYVP